MQSKRVWSSYENHSHFFRGAQKRGISAIVATVLVILITVAGVTIVWAAIIPMIKTNLELGTACLDADVLIDAGSGYTCYDAEKKIVAVQVKKGANEVNIPKIEFLLGLNGTSRKTTKSFGLGSNIGRTFYFVVDEDVEKVSVAPVVKIENKEKSCDIKSNVKLKRCSLVSTNLGEEYVAYWRFEDNLLDVTGRSDGTFSGEPVYVEGRNGFGRALSFDGDGDYINCGGADFFNISGELTVSAWVYPKKNATTQGRMAVNMYDYRGNGVGNDTGWYLGQVWTGDYFSMSIDDGAGGGDDARYNGFFNEYLNQWVHVVGVYKPSQYVYLYINGELAASDTTGVKSSIVYSNDPLVIGRRSAQAQSYWNGTIDEVMIYNRVLSEDEIKELYEFQK